MVGAVTRLMRSIFSMLRSNGEGSYFKHAKYGKVYYPMYDRVGELSDEEPEIYNRNGERMRVFFYRDRITATHPCGSSTHWLWDWYNFGLKTHFYTHWELLTTMGHPDHRYGAFTESPAITPGSYEIFRTHPGLEKDFDAIFTYDHRLLNELDNARFVPFVAGPAYGNPFHGGTFDDRAFEKKSKLISMISSNKQQCELHKYRIDTAKQCKREGLADTFGTFDGGPFVEKFADVLTDYRYSVMIENDITPYYFSERLTAAFAAMTVPVYCGAEKIGDFFNEDGIIRLRPGDDIRKVLAQCSPRDYESRLPAIVDNYRRALEYCNIWDWLYERYLKGVV